MTNAKTTDGENFRLCVVLNRRQAYDFNFSITRLLAWRFLSFVSGFCSATFFVRARRCSELETRKHVNEELQRRQYRLLRYAPDLARDLAGLFDTVRLLSSVAMAVAVAMAVTVAMAFAVAVAMAVSELGAIDGGRVSVSGLEVSHEMTFVGQTHLVRNLFHAQET